MIEGTFIDGRPKGKCRWLWDDGKVYEGDIKDYQCNGKGFMRINPMIYPKLVYNGEFKNNKLVNGKATLENEEVTNLMKKIRVKLVNGL